MERRFESKCDTWFSIIIFSSVLVTAGVLWPAFYYPEHWMFIPMFVLCAGTIALLLWVTFGTYYVISDSVLRIYHGPFRWNIPLKTIEDIVVTRSIISSPALSMDRLRITYNSGRKVMISPVQQQEFLHAVNFGSL